MTRGHSYQQYNPGESRDQVSSPSQPLTLSLDYNATLAPLGSPSFAARMLQNWTAAMNPRLLSSLQASLAGIPTPEERLTPLTQQYENLGYQALLANILLKSVGSQPNNGVNTEGGQSFQMQNNTTNHGNDQDFQQVNGQHHSSLRKLEEQIGSEASSSEAASVSTVSVQVPCRARGMPPNHNYKTASFEIKEGMKHGQELQCSHVACRAAGPKFCYCAHCKIPVAKRNFRIRHHHIEQDPLPTVGSDEYERFHSSQCHEVPPSGDERVSSVEVMSRPAQAAGGQSVTASASSSLSDLHKSVSQAGDHGRSSRRGARTWQFPCRARNMPPDHNAHYALPPTLMQMAHFLVPEDVKHGADMICSYEACRAMGPKFAFCLYCRAPVARRNLQPHHSHGKNLTLPFVAPRATSLNGDDPEQTGEFIKRNSEEAEDWDCTPSEMVERRRRWNTLLIQRPKNDNSHNLTLWLSKVLSVSDTQIPLEESLRGVDSYTPLPRQPTRLGNDSQNEIDQSSGTVDSDSSSGSVDSEEHKVDSAPTAKRRRVS